MQHEPPRSAASLSLQNLRTPRRFLAVVSMSIHNLDQSTFRAPLLTESPGKQVNAKRKTD